MTAYEQLMEKIDRLIEQGQRLDVSVGQREAYYREAQRLREALDDMTIEEAGCENI